MPTEHNPDLQKNLEFLAQHPEIKTLEVILCDYNGRARGKLIDPDNIAKLYQQGFKMPVTALYLDIWGRDIEEIVFATGDADGLCLPVAGSLKQQPWQPDTAQIQVTMASTATAEADPTDPRNILQAVQQRFNEQGLTPVVALEMEFYLLRETLDSKGNPEHSSVDLFGHTDVGGQPYDLDAMNQHRALWQELKDACAALGIPADTFVKEAAPSQYEINLYHTANPVQAADQAFWLKRTIRAVCKKYGFIASFMAKPFGNEAGNGMHMHFSCLDKDGNNVYDNGTEKGSDQLRHAIAGLQLAMPASMAIFAPHLNSYRRFQAGSHAPLSPSWGYENRTVSLRVPDSDNKARRIEHRVAGADANPYLIMAVVLAGAFQGMENKLVADEPIAGDAYTLCEASLPQYWPDAIKAFEQSEFIGQGLGAEFQRIFALTKWQELNQFTAEVTPMEYSSYLKTV